MIDQGDNEIEQKVRDGKKSTLLKKIRGAAIYVLVVAALVYLLPKTLAWTLKTDYPMAAITSNSMWPTLKKGDLVFIQGVAKSDLKVGDIVVYANEQNFFTIHRISELRENDLTTKGDANSVNDSPVKYQDIVGRLLRFGSHYARLPKLGIISITVGKKIKQ